MTDNEVFKILIFILAKRNGGTLTINKIDLLQYAPSVTEKLYFNEDIENHKWILEVKDE
jgi:hypothetical protein